MNDVQNLIEAVKKRPALWDFAHPQRHSRTVLDVLWADVARPFGVSADDARRKWKGLRDTFRKELRKYPNGFDEDIPPDLQPTWVFFRPLYFLKGQMKARNRYEVYPDYVVDVRKEEDTENSMMLTENPSAIAEDLVDLCSDVGDAIDPISDLGEQTLKETEDEDYHFFMSLLPHVRKLQPLHKLQVRAKIQDLICNEVYGSARQLNMSSASGGRKSEPIDPLL